MRYSLFFLLIILCSCTYNELDPISDCDSDNPSFAICVKPIIDNNCLGCHSESSLNGDLSSYESIQEYIINQDLLDRVQRNINEIGFMPLGGNKLDDKQIDILIKWRNNGAPNN